jgi:hypothetical protein
MEDILIKNASWLVETMKQSKNGITFFLPNERIENEIL